LALLFRPYLSETFYGGEFNKKFVVVGPKGIKEFVSEVAQVFHHNALMKYQKIEYLDFKPEMDFDSFKINVYPVTHLGLDANAIKLTAEGKTFAYTGDAELSPGVIEAAKDVDLLITDAATPKKYPANAHMSTAQVGEICRDNGVKKVILTHQVPLGYNVDMVGEVKEVFDGEIILAKDLMEINL
jgi:ribonuclease BN (tRNA processing enzyme)